MDSNLRVKPVPTLQSKTVEMLRKYINSTYPLGEKIPGEHELAMTLGVNRGTVRSALSILEREGLIIRRRGDGTYTNPHVLGIKTRLEDLVEYK
ncbi:MAG: GntR family transcriptional regulator, partial [Chloroflexi bacterium]|nr:GntR family transcriptional regulator [Chloroflexota bacterium]